jgi:hypothetical protein
MKMLAFVFLHVLRRGVAMEQVIALIAIQQRGGEKEGACDVSDKERMPGEPARFV